MRVRDGKLDALANDEASQVFLGLPGERLVDRPFLTAQLRDNQPGQDQRLLWWRTIRGGGSDQDLVRQR